MEHYTVIKKNEVEFIWAEVEQSQKQSIIIWCVMQLVGS